MLQDAPERRFAKSVLALEGRRSGVVCPSG